jgi:hypothetical protein
MYEQRLVAYTLYIHNKGAHSSTGTRAAAPAAYTQSEKEWLNAQA